MNNNVVNNVSYIRTSRDFPTEAKELSVELNKAYVDIANSVNARTIGIFPTNRPVVTGESWFITQNQRQQTLRQVYKITSYASFNHNINFTGVTTFTKIMGIGYDGANYFTIPYVDSVSITAQVPIFVSPTQVVMAAGALAPVIQRGIIILEWLSPP